MASIRKDRNRWRAEVYRQGHARMSKSFATRAEAARWARETEAGLDNGAMANLTNRTLAEAIDRYIQEYDPPPYERTIMAFWREELGRMKLSSIRKAHVLQARKVMAKQTAQRSGEPLAPATINRRVALLSRLFRIFEQEWDWVQGNPCRIRALAEDNRRDRILTEEERTRLLAALRANPDPCIFGFVLVAMSTGMRAGEVVALRWENVDLETGAIQILKSKNGERRAVVAGEDAVAWLKSWKKESGLRFGGRVFGNHITGRGMFAYSKPWGEARKAAKLEDLRFHDLRHTFVTEALSAGLNPMLVMAVSGHKSAAMLWRYSHLTTDVAKAVSEAVQGSRLTPGSSND